ncbi:MAG: hypothetical protein WCS09_16250 [Pseudomonadota bacterium]
MNFYPYLAIDIPKKANGLIAADKTTLASFWKAAETSLEPGVPEAIGCYIFSIKAGPGELPWYVGMAGKQSFRKECFTPHKIQHYNNAIAARRGSPRLTLLAKYTPGLKFVKPTSARQRDVEELETLLIANALSRNPDLLNVRDTKLLREMVVPGLLNTPPGQPNAAVKRFKSLLGL